MFVADPEQQLFEIVRGGCGSDRVLVEECAALRGARTAEVTPDGLPEMRFRAEAVTLGLVRGSLERSTLGSLGEVDQVRAGRVTGILRLWVTSSPSRARWADKPLRGLRPPSPGTVT